MWLSLHIRQSMLPRSALLWFGTFALLCVTGCSPVQADHLISLPRSGLSADEVAVLINENDPLSRQTGTYYQQARHIPDSNIIRLHLPTGKTTLSGSDFAVIKREIEQLTKPGIQAYAVAWSEPYRVGCMSMTSALALGFDEKYCSSKCGATAATSYFNSPSVSPFEDHQIRPAMMLAGTDFSQIKALIDRGVAADQSFPEGKAYLLNTSDQTRSVRARLFDRSVTEFEGMIAIEKIDADFIVDRNNVLFYFTGLAQVPKLDTLTFMPGARADHLTSHGGQLTDSSQMSSLRWLEAGATASYGTVMEPCNHPQKFPLPALAIYHYLSGATAIEAYWKSVAWPGEGVFIGEPLARPFAPQIKLDDNGDYVLRLISPSNTRWQLEHADSPMGPFLKTSVSLPIRRGKNLLHFRLPTDAKAFLRLVK